MEVYFRELTVDDIPAIKDISKDIWNGEDYVPYVIDEWLQDKKSMNYGTFKDKNKTELIGFGRVKIYNNEIAWLEGGRIKISYQGKGIGKKQLGYAVEYAAKLGLKVAQYDTASDNAASISLAKYYGFKQKKSMDIVIATPNEINLSATRLSNVEKLPSMNAKEIYNKCNIGPGDEICIGWSFIPLQNLTDEHGSWFYNKKSILQKIEFGGFHDYELPSEKEIWMIVYGNPIAAQELIQFTVQKELKSKENKIFEVFCKPDVAELIKEMGFRYYKDEWFGVLLFEKFF
ncbi:MAG: GNAT family N-acetyltransferase [Candidatus Odinarchaeota archaeon]